MRGFDAKKASGKNFSVSDNNLLILNQSAFVKYKIGKLGLRNNLKVIGRKRTGNGAISVKILSRNGSILFANDFSFTKRSYSEFGVSFDLKEEADGCILCIDRKNNSFGTVEIGILNVKIISDKSSAKGGAGKSPFAALKKVTYDKKVVAQRSLDKKAEYFDYCFKRKIAFIIPYSICGGAEIYLKNIINNMDYKQFDISVLYLKKNQLSSMLKKNVNNINVGTHNHLATNLIASNYDYIVYYNSYMVYLMLIKLLGKNAINSFIYEIYHSDFIWPDSLAKYRNRKYVNALFSISDSLANDIGGIKNKYTLPVPIDSSVFTKKDASDLRKELGIKESDIVIGTVSRLSPEKNIKYILNIAKQMSDFIFVIVGDGPEKKAFEGIISKNKLSNVKLIGYRKNTFDYYNIFDAFILASTCSEGTPITILEAMSSEVPVFTTFSGAISSFAVDEENCIELLLSIDDDCKKIRDNIKNNVIVNNAKKYVLKNHNLDRIVNKFVESILCEDSYEKKDLTHDDIIISGYYA